MSRVYSCSNCVCDTENEPFTLCDECKADGAPVAYPATAERDRIIAIIEEVCAEQELQFAKAQQPIFVSCTILLRDRLLAQVRS
jgi:hypothetical protein